MIRINLIPGAHKRTSSTTFGLGALGTFRGHIKDPWLLGAATAVVVAVAAVGLLYTAQQVQASDMAARHERAQRDSIRYSGVLESRRKVLEERQTVERQLAVIRSIDEVRYQWAHILDEASRALPSYTWLTVIEQTSKAAAPPSIDTVKPAARPRDRDAAAAKAKADSIEAAQPAELRFRLVGQTIDIQALTLYMRQLESSPFIEKVSLARSEIVVLEGKDVTEFELTASFESPAPGVIKTAALVVPVR
jgi:Tfp pilus assembly protein PilN